MRYQALFLGLAIAVGVQQFSKMGMKNPYINQIFLDISIDNLVYRLAGGIHGSCGIKKSPTMLLRG